MTLIASANLSRGDVTVLFLSVGVLLVFARALGEVAKRLRQPDVLGEILAGILLGPTVLGWMCPSACAFLFPPDGNVAVSLNALTTLAIALFLLVAGMEVDLSTVWRQGRSALLVSLLGMSLPFGLGFAAASIAPVWLGAQGDRHVVFALFFATALSISALPVIAKILMDLNLYRSDLGMVIVASAIVNDLAGWIIFAFLLGMMGPVHGGGHSVGLGWTVVLILVFTLVMLTLGRWVVDKAVPWFQAHMTWPGGIIGMTLAAALVCAAFTEAIGVHAIFGAFIFGVALGDSRHLREQTRATLDQFISFFFAPLFFATIGLRVNFATNFSLLLVITVLAIATAGKVLGCGWGARLAGFKQREAWAIGFGMNARGAMEIILGLLARQAGVIGDKLFVALVLMALATSASSGYFIQRLLGMKKRIRLTDFLTSARFQPRLQSSDRRAAITELVQVACDGASLDPAAVERRVWAREQLMSNGLPNGVAVPHARIPGLEQPLVAVGFSEAGIDFDSRDGAPARLICLLLTPFNDYKVQLDLLSDIGRTFDDRAMVEKALEASNYTEFLAILKSTGAANQRRHQNPKPVLVAKT